MTVCPIRSGFSTTRSRNLNCAPLLSRPAKCSHGGAVIGVDTFEHRRQGRLEHIVKPAPRQSFQGDFFGVNEYLKRNVGLRECMISRRNQRRDENEKHEKREADRPRARVLAQSSASGSDARGLRERHLRLSLSLGSGRFLQSHQPCGDLSRRLRGTCARCAGRKRL